jgi:hypothetical protein
MDRSNKTEILSGGKYFLIRNFFDRDPICLEVSTEGYVSPVPCSKLRRGMPFSVEVPDQSVGFDNIRGIPVSVWGGANIRYFINEQDSSLVRIISVITNYKRFSDQFLGNS